MAHSGMSISQESSEANRALTVAVELKASGSRRSETKIKILTKPWDGRIIVQLVIYFYDTTYVYDTLGVRLLIA